MFLKMFSDVRISYSIRFMFVIIGSVMELEDLGKSLLFNQKLQALQLL